MVSVLNATLTITPVTLCLYNDNTLYSIGKKKMKTISMVKTNSKKVELRYKTITFYGDSLVDNRLPVMVFFNKDHIVICDYSELGLYIGSKQNVKPLEAPLLLALQYINLFSDITQAKSDNRSFREFISKLTQ